ncbi:concanavalin A-like lectin/glucanase domain-containing protein [Gautieria morchelliformis]|nr:concanavalin A-like lectin/glucanase domain-containing protein [Gautieria morchelliformis]
MPSLLAPVLLTLCASFSAAAFTTLPKPTTLLSSLLPWSRPPEKRAVISEIWIPEDTYQGSTFFDTWDFFDQADPTHYVNSSVAFSENLAMVTPDNQVIMRMDNTTWLPNNGLRNSVRISSQKRYNGGLFILDLNRAPWGCSVWPAFWTVGDNWPNNGEIDVFEGVHDNTHNQITWHTANGCNLTVPGNFTGTPSVRTQNHTACGSSNADNSGCAITDWSRASYGPQFDALNGGVYAMKWDQDSIAIWFFYRASIPTDIIQHAPDPSGWGLPSAELASTECNLNKFFIQHQIVFDHPVLMLSMPMTSVVGDWAGASFATSGCPGSCGQTVQDPNNFINASWIINSLHVYSQTSVTGASRSGEIRADVSFVITTALLTSFIVMAWTCSL